MNRLKAYAAAALAVSLVVAVLVTVIVIGNAYPFETLAAICLLVFIGLGEVYYQETNQASQRDAGPAGPDDVHK